MMDEKDDMDPAADTRISTLVFLDFEATGLLGNGQRPKITELCLLAVQREDLLADTSFPRVVNKLTLCLNPKKPIQFMSSQITGLYNDNLERQKDFSKDTVSLLNAFLSHLEQPVCLIAHFGNGYDFPLLQAELVRINQSLSVDIFCADSIEIFRALDCLEIVKNYSSDETVEGKITSIPTPVKSSYTTPEKACTALPPVLKRKTSELNSEFTPKRQKYTAATSDVKRTLSFEGTERDISKMANTNTSVNDSKTNTKATDDALKKELLEEFEFSEIEDHEYIAAADFAENSILKTVNVVSAAQNSNTNGDQSVNRTAEVTEENVNLNQNRYCGDYVMTGSGYSVRVETKINTPCEAYLESTLPYSVDDVTKVTEDSKLLGETNSSGSNNTNKSELCNLPSTCRVISAVDRSAPCVSALISSGPNSSEEESTPDGKASTPAVRGSSPLKSVTPSPSPSTSVKKKSYKLVEIYTRLHGRAPPASHRAEDDCITLLLCAQKTKDFVDMLDKHAAFFSTIQPGY